MVICVGLLVAAADNQTFLAVWKSNAKDIKHFIFVWVNPSDSINEINSFFKKSGKKIKEVVNFFCCEFGPAYKNEFRKHFFEAATRHSFQNVSFITTEKSLLIRALTRRNSATRILNGDVFWTIGNYSKHISCSIWRYDETCGWKFKGYHSQDKRLQLSLYSYSEKDLQILKAKVEEDGVIPFIYVFAMDYDETNNYILSFPNQIRFKSVFDTYKEINFYDYGRCSMANYARHLTEETDSTTLSIEDILERRIEIRMNEEIVVYVPRFQSLPLEKSAVIKSSISDSIKIFDDGDCMSTIQLKMEGMCEVKLTIDVNGICSVIKNPAKKENQSAFSINSNSIMFGNQTVLFDDEGVPETAGILDLEVDETDSAMLSQLFVEDEVYSNFTSPKGLALIINNRKFKKHKERYGTEIDEENIRKLLTDLGYKIEETQHNLSGDNMLLVAEYFANKKLHKSYDSCAVVVLTHGKYDYFCGTDGSQISVHEFLQKFNSINAPLLKGKPKLFFFQACRGSNRDPGIDSTDTGNLNEDVPEPLEDGISTLSLTEETNTSSNISAQLKTQKLPTEADMLIAFATTPQYVSWRNDTKGSWFIQSVCEIFSKHAKDEDICSLLTRVNRRVAQVYQSSKNGQKQIPEFVTRLQKRFYFFPGIKMPKQRRPRQN